MYGELKFYPANALAHAFADLAGLKTFPPHKIEQIKAMGFTVMAGGPAPRQL